MRNMEHTDNKEGIIRNNTGDTGEAQAWSHTASGEWVRSPKLNVRPDDD